MTDKPVDLSPDPLRQAITRLRDGARRNREDGWADQLDIALAARSLGAEAGLRERIEAIPWNPGTNMEPIDPEWAVSEYRDAVLAATQED